MTQSISVLDIPEEWQKLAPGNLHGILLVVGAPDTGKTTFARYLFDQLNAKAPGKTGFLDGDPGQSQLGPPATMTLSFQPGESPDNTARRWFVGAISPRGHMLPVVVGAARLVEAARAGGAATIVYDTSGLIDPSLGGRALKLAKIDLLRPQVVFAIQRQGELEPLLTPLERSAAVRVVRLAPSDAIEPRDQTARRLHREMQFAHYFHEARLLSLDWRRLAVWPAPAFSLGRLVALEDQRSYTLALGVIAEIDRPSSRLGIRTPLPSTAELRAIRLGDLCLDPDTGEHTSLTE